MEHVRTWWYAEGISAYKYTTEIVLTSDYGGSNGYRTCLWKRELKNLAKEKKKPVSVMYYPPGTGIGNKIEHGLL